MFKRKIGKMPVRNQQPSDFIDLSSSAPEQSTGTPLHPSPREATSIPLAYHSLSRCPHYDFSLVLVLVIVFVLVALFASALPEDLRGRCTSLCLQ